MWASTPRLLHALTKRRDFAERRQDLRFGLLASIVVNGFGGDSKPSDFFEGPDQVEQWDEEATLAVALKMIENAKREQDDERDS